MPTANIEQTVQLVIRQARAHQQQCWREEMTDDNRRLGWKAGFNRKIDQTKFGLPSAIIGCLSSGCQIQNGGVCHTIPEANLLAEQEISLRMGADINGEQQFSLEPDRVPDEFSNLITTVANILADQDEYLHADDWKITGAAATPIGIKAGDKQLLKMEPLGEVELNVE